MDDIAEDSRPAPPGFIKKIFLTISQRYQKFLDSTVPHLPLRWIATLVMILLFLVRVFFLQGWYIVTYALGIYHLNLFIAFLTPKIDPALDELEEDGPELPTRSDQEFRPFIRRLPEFKFWYGATRAVVIAIICTFFEFFNIPVFWPILVMYFIVLFIITMKRQIKHMIRYRYIPFTYGKQKYRGKEDTDDTMKS
ncbi:retention in endoplasmic reticulum protein 1 [Desmophyllum pertusum]|uniref:Protein RER1 n=1 Tax=Desmophyllum pertusum TaxID=174260 RepID=A0A9X0DCD9_9CNID|nr:retention in endoplasmic reticulum protein 1 [Desmophyllum pertusum]